MPNRRELKKKIKSSTNVIIEEGFMEAINGDKKEREKMDQIIDEVIDYRVDLVGRISTYPRHAKRSETKKHFQEIKDQLSNNNSEYSKKIGHVS